MSFTALEIHRIATAADLPQRVARAVGGGRRLDGGRTRMSPELSYGRHAGPAPATARRAAVVLLLFRRGDQWRLPLTQRPASLMRHGGQVSLPGGAVEPGESSSLAALRELEEELGVASEIELLGQLADCYVFASDFVITPWIAAAAFEPQWRPHAREVQGVVELPIATLLDGSSCDTTTIDRGPFVFRAPCLRIGPACVWGATAVILSELAALLRVA